MLGVFKRALGFDTPVNVKRQLYFSNIRNILEYCSVMWSPYHVKDILAIERVQRHATKYMLNYADMSYRDRCITLHLLPLCYRREILDLLFMFKCVKGILHIPFIELFTRARVNTKLRSGCNGMLFVKPRT